MTVKRPADYICPWCGFHGHRGNCIRQLEKVLDAGSGPSTPGLLDAWMIANRDAEPPRWRRVR